MLQRQEGALRVAACNTRGRSLRVTPDRRCTPEWRHTARLRDGTKVHMRLVRPGDKRLFVEAFERLSPTSRYRRFLTPKPRLSERDLRYLTEVDGENHLAIGAVIGEPPDEQGVGVARFVRLQQQPDVAEAAVVVTDDAQGKGLGQLLLAWLTVAARERGVRAFGCRVMADNAPVLAILQEHVPASSLRAEADGAVVALVELKDIPEPPASSAERHRHAFPLLRLVARDLVQVVSRLETLGSRLWMRAEQAPDSQ